MVKGYKKVLPEDVYTSINSVEKIVEAADGTITKHYVCPNKISGVEFMDMFAGYVWAKPYGSHAYYATKMNVSIKELGQTVRVLSGISTQEWRDRFLNMAACELLLDSELSITEVANELGFGNLVLFSRFFLRHNKQRPLYWRYYKRGCNVSRNDILKLRLRKAGLSDEVK